MERIRIVLILLFLCVSITLSASGVIKSEGTDREATGFGEKIFYQSDNGRITGKIKYWNDKPWEHTIFEYDHELSLCNVQTMIYHGNKVSLMRKDLSHFLDTATQPDQKLETWYYYFGKDQANALRQIDTYWPGTDRVKERQLFDETGGLKATALFEYDTDANHELDLKQNTLSVTRMILMDESSRIISDYHEATEVNLNSIYTAPNFTPAEIACRLDVSRDGTRIPILIMDSGIDINHPTIAYKMWRNPFEIPNGRDDDGNSLTDDIYGISDNPRLGQPVQDLILPRFDLPTFSHGTLVASIATQGRKDAAIMAASEITTIYSSDILQKIEIFIKEHRVRYTNMSFAFDKQLLTSGAGAERIHQLNELIKNTPGTLHVVAADNCSCFNGKGFNVDRYRHEGDVVPAMLLQDNILVAGALDTDRLEPQKYPTYELAKFSNVGEISVDILAPGTRMCGAQMGGGTTCQDGTSFAAPYVLNHGVLNVTRTNPNLNIYQIKEILMKTAYVPDLDYPFPVRSGGILHPQRAVAVAEWLLKHPNTSVEEAVLAVRRAELHPLPGELNTGLYLKALQSFWALHRIGHESTKDKG